MSRRRRKATVYDFHNIYTLMQALKMVETMAEAFECTFKQQEKLQVQTKRLIYSLYLFFSISITAKPKRVTAGCKRENCCNKY